MVKIAFEHDHLGIRGTTVALYDYAYYNIKILNNESIIVVPKSDTSDNDKDIIKKFENEFKVYWYENMNDLENILKSENCDIYYTITYGKKKDVPNNIKTVVHCVFDMSEPHGDVYAGVSEAVAIKYNQPLFVPHMIGLKPFITNDNLRNELRIPENAIVFGRYGGQDTFNLYFCWKAMKFILNYYPNIYFLFANTPKLIEHNNIKYIDKVVTEKEKIKFINTCDAHLECGTLGHSFGLSIGEFSVNNKPIIAYLGQLWNDSHIRILGNDGIYFRNEIEFIHILTNFDPKQFKDKDLNCYKDYSPEKVMKIFKEVFID